VEGRVKGYDRTVAEAAIDEAADFLVAFIAALRMRASARCGKYYKHLVSVEP